jgi:hypothetical protein
LSFDRFTAYHARWVGSGRVRSSGLVRSCLVRLSRVQSSWVIGLGSGGLGRRVWSGWVGSSLVGLTKRIATANLVRERVALVRARLFVIM